ncbi:MAG: LamG-like jellyroll fold domain-containing protein [Verrucomicrobiota bacterium]
MSSKTKSPRSQALGICMLAALANHAHGQIQKAGDLLVDLNFTTLTPGDLTFIPNPGTLGGGFEAIGDASTFPSVETIPGSTVKALHFDGTDFMMSVTGATPLGGEPSRLEAPLPLVGPQPTRSVEAWVYNTPSREETVLAWGKRGANSINFSCLYGYDPGWGALGQWGDADLPWTEVPLSGVWHHLTWVHTGPGGGGNEADTTLVYVDGVLNNQEGGFVLNTTPTPILLGTQFDNDGVTPSTGTGLRGILDLGKVRIHSGVLTAANVLNNYNLEKAAFPAPATPAASLASGPMHRWSFGEASGTKVTDSAGAYPGIVKGAGFSWSTDGTQLDLGAGGSGNTAAYVDLPNRLVSRNAPELGGSGEVTLEMWATVTTVQNWGRFFDFGSTSGNEITGPGNTVVGGGIEGWDYLVVTASEGTNGARTQFTLRQRDPLGNGPAGAGGPADVSASATYDTGSFTTQRHVTVVWKEGQSIEVYENGQPVRELRPGEVKMVQLNDVNCWLGRSNWIADNNLGGTIDEFRIYDRALGPTEVLKNEADGPAAALPPPQDTDGDGLPDWFERLHVSATMNYTVAGTPSQATLNGDTDSLTNLQEYQRGTNPLVPDTDGDGLDDGQEVTRNTDPLVTDTDGDGLSDGQEVNTYLSNPLALDSDGDGYTDLQEVNGGSNPNNANSIPVIFLVSRYSFNSGAGPATSGAIVPDSISGLNAVVRGNNATWTGNALSLPGGGSAEAAYADLPNYSISRFAKAKGGRGAVTLEGWMTIPMRGGAGWQRILDFGSAGPGMKLGEIFGPGRTLTGNVDGQDYIFLSAARGDDTNLRRLDWTNNDRTGGLGNSGGVDFNASTGTLDTPFHFAITIDENVGAAFYYENGVQVATFNTPLKLEALNDVNSWLGRSNWTNDQNLQGEFDEFRIYAGAFSAADALKSFNKGANTLPNGTNAATDITTLKVTNPNGWPEWWVDRNPTPPLPAPGSDSDTDGLTALQELGRGSDPTKKDTDGDGLNDDVETSTGFQTSATNTGTNPAVPDTDNDGLNDGQELAATSNPFDPDTDKDLAFDGQDDKPVSTATSALMPAHRWPFDDLEESIAADSPSVDVIGGAAFNAVIRGNGATSDGSMVNLPGGNNTNDVPYVDLPNGLISGQKAVTLVGWVTINATAANWSRYFDFGNSTNGEVPPNAIGNGTDYFAYTAQRGANINEQRFTIRKDPIGESLYDPNQATELSRQIFYVATADSSSETGSVYNLYRDGEWQLRSAGGAYPLSGIADVNNWLGRSNYAGDSSLNGAYHEFRVYNGVLNQSAVKALYAAGPDGPFAISSITRSGGNALITFPSRIGLNYTVETSPDLATWTDAEIAIPGTGAPITSSVAAGTGRRFFRVSVDD